jgi:hypothetical protein
MATTIKEQYGTSNQTITVTLASLTNNSARASDVVSNTANLFFDVLVGGKVKSGTSVSTSGSVNVYAYGSADGGTTYSDGATGSDAGITLTSPPNVRLIGVINVVADATTYKFGPFSVRQAFGGTLAEKWGLVFENKSGATLDAVGGSFSVFYQGVTEQSV